MYMYVYIHAWPKVHRVKSHTGCLRCCLSNRLVQHDEWQVFSCCFRSSGPCPKVLLKLFGPPPLFFDVVVIVFVSLHLYIPKTTVSCVKKLAWPPPFIYIQSSKLTYGQPKEMQLEKTEITHHFSLRSQYRMAISDLLVQNLSPCQCPSLLPKAIKSYCRVLWTFQRNPPNHHDSDSGLLFPWHNRVKTRCSTQIRRTPPYNVEHLSFIVLSAEAAIGQGYHGGLKAASVPTSPSTNTCRSNRV